MVACHRARTPAHRAWVLGAGLVGAGLLGCAPAIQSGAQGGIEGSLAALALTFVALLVLVVKGDAQRRRLERDSRARETMMLELMRDRVGGGRMSPELRARAERVGLDPDRLGGSSAGKG